MMKDESDKKTFSGITQRSITAAQDNSYLLSWSFPESLIIRHIFDELPDAHPQKPELQNLLKNSAAMRERYDMYKSIIEENNIDSPEAASDFVTQLMRSR